MLGKKEASNFAKRLNYRSNGLVVVVAQDVTTDKVLMVAFANREAVEKTLTTGRVHYWSRQREKIWMKGETSGHYQFLKEIYVDCDLDALLIKIEQVGAACHTDNRSCFFRKLKGKRLEKVI